MHDLKKVVAQLICVEIRINELKDNPKKLDELKKSFYDNQWGSVIFFDGDVSTASKIIDDLQLKAEIPLFVCADLERGAGQHFKGAVDLPSNMAIAASDKLNLAYKAGKVTAQEAKDIGVNVVFAPDADVNSNPNNPIINIRSYGEDPVKVADMAQAFIKGCHSESVLATAKHFPGHGDTSTDSHVQLPVVKKSLKALEKIEFYPFVELIKEELHAIMSSHISIPALEPKMIPATFSYKIMTELLREKMGFEGLVFTDALNMGGAKIDIENTYDVQALLAGCDILLMPPDPQEALNRILTAIKNNVLTEARIMESYNRVMKFKNIYCDKNYKKMPSRINSERNKIFAKTLAEEALTKIKASKKLPLTNEKNSILNLVIDQDNDPTRWSTLANLLETEHQVKTEVINADTTLTELENLTQALQNSELVIVSFFSQIRAWKDNMYPNKEVLAWIEKHILKEKEHIVITFSNPYLLKKLKNVSDYYCTYSDSVVSQEAVIKMLFGDLKPTGKSPVALC